MLPESIPAFYRQILFVWFDLKTEPVELEDYKREILWFNKFIKIDHKELFIKPWYDRRMVYINDILKSNGHFLSCHEVSVKFNIQINTFLYMQMIDAIPNSWRVKFKQRRGLINLCLSKEQPFIKLFNIDRPLQLLSSRDVLIKNM